MAEMCASLFDDEELIEIRKPVRKVRGRMPKKTFQKQAMEDIEMSLFEEEVDVSESEVVAEAEKLSDEEVGYAAETFGLSYFLNEADKYKIMSQEEEQEIFRRYRETNDIEIRNAIMCSNIKLVVSVAKKISKKNNKLPLEDLISEGFFGLMKAIDKFEIERNLKFSTYAFQWIRQTITRAIANTGDCIRVPVHFSDNMVKITRFETQYKQEHCCDRVDDEITSKALGIDLDKVQKFKGAVKVTSSIDSEIGDKAITYKDVILDENMLSPEDQLMENLWNTEFMSIIKKTLEPQEAYIIMNHYDMGDDKPLTPEKMAKKLGITSDKVKQLEADALAKLHKPMERFLLRHAI